MNDDEEEDVIFEGSPLYDYLKEACPTEEFESSLPQSKEVQQVTPGSSASREYGYPTVILSGLGSLGLSWIACVCRRVLFWTPSPEHFGYDQRVPCQKIVAKVTKSRLLNEADQWVVTSLGRCVEEETQSYQPVSLLPVIFSGLLFLGASLCFLLPQVTMIVSVGQPPVAVPDWLEIFLGVVLLRTSLRIAWRGLIQKRITSVYTHLDTETDRYIHKEGMFLKGFRRSLQYIQEVEVLSRGYTMVNVPSSSRASSGSQLLPLRKVCLLVVTRHLAALRAATGALTEQFPVPLEFRLPKDCISNQEIPEWISDIATNQQTLENQSDPEMYTLTTLKILFGLYKQQCSDFYRQLIVSLVCSDKLSNVESTDLQELLNWQEVTTTLSTECEESTQRLTQAYKVHRWSPTPDTPGRPEEVSRREVWRPEVQCTIAVHSLRLHLETMLARISSVDDELSYCEAISVTEDRVTELQTLLAEMGDHMEASQICCQEAKASLEKLTRTEDPQESLAENTEVEPRAESQEPMERIPITAEYLEDIDGDLDEQIFEAYIDAKKKQLKEEESEEWLQERIQRRREAEDAKRMLLELNSVLTQRSKEKERNKQEKLLKQQEKQPESQSAAGGMGESNNSMPPIENEYSLSESPVNDNAASLQRSDQPEQERNGSHPDKRSANSTGYEDYSVGSTSSPSCEGSPGTAEVSPKFGCGDGPHIDSSKPVPSISASEFPCSISTNPSERSEDLNREEKQELSLSNSPSSDHAHNGNIFHEAGVYSAGDPQQDEQETISDDVSTTPCSYECESSRGQGDGPKASPELSAERPSFFAINPWMNSGLAAQVARISLERNNLSEETFGEDDSDGS